MSELNRHIADLIEHYDKFRNTFNGYYINAVSEDVEWLRAYMKSENERQRNKRQLKIFEQNEDI